MIRLRRLFLLLLLLPLADCARQRRAFPGCSIFIVSIDTLRSDHLPAYGYGGVETPHLDALARDSVIFERAYAHVPLTLPSHATLFTGLLPPENGVRDNVANSLAPGHETMASFFSEHGYATGGAVSAVVLSHETGIGRGFGFYEDSVEPTRIRESLGRVQRPGAETERKLVEWIDGEKRRPLFAFLHLYEPHAPYEPPEPFASRYRDRPYDGEIAAADAVVGDFVSALKARGLYDGSIVVLLSDHGEGLGDHGEPEHGIFLYREEIQVPIVLKLPRRGGHGQRLSTPVGLVDLFPTLAALAGLAPPHGLSGARLDPLLFGGRPPDRAVYSETFYPRFHLGWSDLASLVTDRHQFIEAPRPELYDLRADPAEKRDLSATGSSELRRLRLELARQRRPAAAPAAADPEHARKLASLGYLTGAAPETSGPLPDPKDRIGEVERLKEAFGHFTRGEYEGAALLLSALVHERPSMSDAWEMYAQTLRRLERNDEALAAYRAADRLTPGNAPLLLEMSHFLLESGSLDEAKAYARLAEAAGAPQVHETLAQIAIAGHDLATAESEARQALGGHSGRRIPLLILARISRERGDLPAALSYLDELARLTREKGLPLLSTANGLRGDVLARLGKDEAAEAAFREEIRLFPENPQAWCNLALLYGSEGRASLAKETLLGLVRAAPHADSFRAARETAQILGDRETATLIGHEADRRLGRSASGSRRGSLPLATQR
jgi:arylsulfatase A-like enzyme/Tfp pilus assembly protein PilF